MGKFAGREVRIWVDGQEITGQFTAFSAMTAKEEAEAREAVAEAERILGIEPSEDEKG